MCYNHHMAGGKKEISKNVLQLSILEGKKFVPRDHELERCNVYSSDTLQPRFIDQDCGIFLDRKHYLLGKYSPGTVEICHRGNLEVGIRLSQDSIPTQKIIPFPEFFNISSYKSDKYENRWLSLEYPDAGIFIRKADHNKNIVVNFSKPNTSIFLDIYPYSNSTHPVAVARLSFVSEEKAQQNLTDEINYRKKMKIYFEKRGWGGLTNIR